MKTPCSPFLVLLSSCLATPLVPADDAVSPESRPAVVTIGQAAPAAARHMTVPPGFDVRVVASEPDVHQPIAMTIDERGRLWVAEGFSYPQRRPEGKGLDNLLILEDTDGDGSFDRRKVFASGLNLVSGVEVGFGGVWVGAAPYLLFIPDRNGDDVPDGPPEVVLDGWGYQDTHETLNAFNWGPDGWLYGCQGVFTHSLVGRPGSTDEDRVPLNACVWRYHPTQHLFEVFAHGTSNPWGVDFDDYGQTFITACVIPHLYHVIQGARYQRQAGLHFNPHTYDDIKTIADHLHHAGKRWTAEHADASDRSGGGHAHCGAMIYLGDNFPSEYRNRIFMGNLHGRRINCDSLEPSGSGYVGHHEKDFLHANDLWFLAVTIRSGPDGTVYFSDWYDKQICHNPRPAVWDRTNGRIYNVAYKRGSPVKVNLSALSDAELVALQLNTNDWHVRQARRLLQARGGSPEVHGSLREIIEKHESTPRKLRGLWALHVTGGLTEAYGMQLLEAPQEFIRAWTIQLLLEKRLASETLLKKLARLSRTDPSPVVRLYLASALQRLPLKDRWEIAAGLMTHAGDRQDHNLPLMIWYGVEPLVATDPGRAIALAGEAEIPLIGAYITRRAAANVENLDPLLAALTATADVETQVEILGEIVKAFAGRVDLEQPDAWEKAYEELAQSRDARVAEHIQTIAVKFGDRRIFPHLREVLQDTSHGLERRGRALSVLVGARDEGLIEILHALLDEPPLRGAALRALATYDDQRTADAILQRYDDLTAAEKTDAVTTLASRVAYAERLLKAVESGNLPRTDLSAFSIRQMSSLGSESLNQRIEQTWGSVRKSSEERRLLIEEHKQKLRPAILANADQSRGRAVFSRVCEQCHVLFDKGGNIGPDLTGSNRADLDYVLENILDPSAVVGKDYQLNVFLMTDGRAVSGLITGANESALTVQTVNEEVVLPRRDIIHEELSQDSMMPEGLMDDLTPAEIPALIAYLASPVQVPQAGTPVTIDPTSHVAAGVLEGERLKLLRQPSGSIRPQEMSGFGEDRWSGNHQLWWTGCKPKDHLELSFPVRQAGNYRVEVALTRAVDYGIVQLSIDGEPRGGPIDLFHRGVVPTGPLFLAELELVPGEHTLGVEILGAHPESVNAYMFGLDFIALYAVEEGT